MDSTLINLWFQNLGEWLYTPMQIFTFMGYQQFYLLFIPVIYWCVDPKLGVRLGIGLMASAAVNGMLKLAFHQPRPYWVDPRVQIYSTESSFGMPSGHAQNGIVFWGLLAKKFRTLKSIILLGLIALFIGISRIYLGVHFLGDVLVGWVAGGLLLSLIVHLEEPFLAWFNRRKPQTQLLFAFVGSWGILALVELIRYGLRNYSLPAEWLILSARAHASAPIDPIKSGDFITASATLFGMSAGVILLRSLGWFNPDGTLTQRAARSLIGLLGSFLVWYGLKQIFPAGEGWLPNIFRYLRYALLGFWISYLAPLVFFRLKLAAPCKN